MPADFLDDLANQRRLRIGLEPALRTRPVDQLPARQ